MNTEITDGRASERYAVCGLLDRNGRKGNANRLHAEARTSVPIYTAFERGVELICNNTTTVCECATFL